MKRLTVILTACLISLASLSNVSKGDVETVETTLSTVDAKGRAITVPSKEAGQPKLELEVSRKAKITLDGKPATLDSLRAGQTVVVTYDAALQIATGIEAYLATKPKAGIELFNGTDLEGWMFRSLDDPNANVNDCWVIDPERKVLVCLGNGHNWIETEQDFTNYVLTLDWRIVPGGKSTPSGSGVVLKMTGLHSSGKMARGIEVQINKESSGDMFAIGVPLQSGTVKAAGERPAKFGRLKDAVKPVGEWNKLEMSVLGDQVTIKLNGTLVNQARGARVRPGKIGLLSQGSAFEFRSLRLATK